MRGRGGDTVPLEADDVGEVTEEIGGAGDGNRAGNESAPSGGRSGDTEDAPPNGDRTMTEDR